MSDYRALYRKWRPVDFDDVCGQKGITDVLKYEVACGKVSHAYLFCGSRGTGKTSCAKILAKAVNCLHPKDGNPCNACEACRSIDAGVSTDVIEMDAASNNSVDNVRDMKDEINFTPAELRYRVYIIDEVHMMSPSAFNALLKTLEEPPQYVLFILATTELHKLPTTIVSRCQRFDFRRLSTPVIVSRLAKIAGEEGIDLREDGARVIARAASGGMRDAVSLLELCAGSHTVIDAPLVTAMIGTGDREAAYRMAEALGASDHAAVYRLVADAAETGSDFTVFWQGLIEAYRDIMVARSIPNAREYLDLTDAEAERLAAVAASFTSAKLLYHTSVLQSTLLAMQRTGESTRSVAEIALTRMCDPKTAASPEALALRVETLEKELSRLKFSGALRAFQEATVPPEAAEAQKESPQPAVPPPPLPAEPTGAAPEPPVPYTRWGRVVREIGNAKASLYSPLSKATVLRCADGRFLIKVPAFFARMIAQDGADLSLIAGMLAEAEHCDPQAIRVEIAEQTSADHRTFIEELEDALNPSE